MIATRLGAFADAVPGNCLALFPSYAFLAEVASMLSTAKKRVLVQRRADWQQQISSNLQELLADLDAGKTVDAIEQKFSQVGNHFF